MKQCANCKNVFWLGIFGGDGRGCICGTCDRVAYCGSECLTTHWTQGGHQEVCRSRRNELQLMPIEGRFTATRNDEPIPAGNRPVVPVGGGGRPGAAFGNILRRLVDTSSEAGWQFADDFFSGMRTVLLDMRLNTVILLTRTKGSLREEAENWVKLGGGGGGGGVNPGRQSLLSSPGGLNRGGVDEEKNLTAIEKWKRARARDDRNETQVDRAILYLLDREAALENLLVACNLLLGPSRIPFGVEQAPPQPSSSTSASEDGESSEQQQEIRLPPVVATSSRPVRSTRPPSGFAAPTTPVKKVAPTTTRVTRRQAALAEPPPSEPLTPAPAPAPVPTPKTAKIRRRPLPQPTVEAQMLAKVEQYSNDFPYYGMGLSTEWNPFTKPGIYLMYDWNEEEGSPRNVFSAPALVPDNEMPLGQDNGMSWKIRRARQEWLAGFRRALMGVDSLIGLQDTKDKLANMIETLIVSPLSARAEFMNIALLGAAGTGKTELALRLPVIFYYMGYAPRPYPDNAPTITTKSNWIAPYEGQSAHQARMTMLRGLGRMIIIDEAYTLALDEKDGFGKEALAQMVNDFDEFRGLVITCMLGYQDEMDRMFMVNRGILRRFPNRWVIGNYTAAELRDILLYTAEKKNFFTLPRAVRDSIDLLDLISVLREKGLFKVVNAGAMSAIMKRYRGLFSRQRIADVGAGMSVRVVDHALDLETLFTSIALYAADMGYRVSQEEE